jgi:hypothetical protein
MFTILGNNRDLLAQYTSTAIGEVEMVDNIYRQGIRKMKTLICNDGDLRQIKKHIYSQHHKVSGVDALLEVGAGELLDGSEGDSGSDDM